SPLLSKRRVGLKTLTALREGPTAFGTRDRGICAHILHPGRDRPLDEPLGLLCLPKRAAACGDGFSAQVGAGLSAVIEAGGSPGRQTPGRGLAKFWCLRQRRSQ